MIKTPHKLLSKKSNLFPWFPKEIHSHSRGMGNFVNDACFEIFYSHSHYFRDFGEWEWKFPGIFHSPHISGRDQVVFFSKNAISDIFLSKVKKLDCANGVPYHQNFSWKILVPENGFKRKQLLVLKYIFLRSIFSVDDEFSKSFSFQAIE